MIKNILCLDAFEELKRIQNLYIEDKANYDQVQNASIIYEARNSDYVKYREIEAKINYLHRIEEESGKELYLISDRGYDEIMGPHSKRRNVIMTILFLISIIIINIEYYKVEKEAHVYILRRSYCRWKSDYLWTVLLIKSINICVSFALIKIIEYGSAFKIYGFPYLDAPLKSLTFMEKSTFNISIISYLVGKNLVILFVFLLLNLILSLYFEKKFKKI